MLVTAAAAAAVQFISNTIRCSHKTSLANRKHKA